MARPIRLIEGVYMDLICTRAMTYNTRSLMAGDEFVAANPMDARLLIAIRKAKAKPEARAVVPPPPKAIATEDLSTLREEAKTLGVAVDNRWGEKRLQAEIAKAK